MAPHWSLKDAPRREFLKAGAQGVILARKYSEMRLANLEAASRAAREALRG